APAASASFTWSDRRPRSAERMEGTISIRLICFPSPSHCHLLPVALSPTLSPAGRGGSASVCSLVDQPFRVGNHPGWDFGLFGLGYCFGFAPAGGQDDYAPCCS